MMKDIIKSCYKYVSGKSNNENEELKSSVTSFTIGKIKRTINYLENNSIK